MDSGSLRSWRLALPWVPSANRYWRSIVIPGQKHAQHYVGDAGKAYRKALAELAVLYRWPRGLTARLALHLILFQPDRRQIDIDNRIKILLDALGTATRPKETKAGVFVDDGQIDDVRVQRGPVVKDGLIHAVLSELPASGCNLAVGAWPVAVHAVRPHELTAPIGVGPAPAPLRETRDLLEETDTMRHGCGHHA